MLRRTFDRIPILAGLVVAAVMIVGGVLLMLGHSFVINQVGNEVSAQKITFPSSQQIAALPASDASAISKYAGVFMTTGPEAGAYANNYLSVQINHIAGGRSYSQLVAESAATPRTDVAQVKVLQQQTAFVFRDQIMQGQLLSAYGYWHLGQVMLIAAFVAFATAIVLLLASVIAMARLRQTATEAESAPKLAPRPAVEPA